MALLSYSIGPPRRRQRFCTSSWQETWQERVAIEPQQSPFKPEVDEEDWENHITADSWQMWNIKKILPQI